MNIPSSFLIGRSRFNIIIENELLSGKDNSERAHGVINYTLKTIKLEGQLLNGRLERFVTTVIHEVSHGILYEAGYNKHSEEDADELGDLLYKCLQLEDFSWLKLCEDDVPIKELESYTYELSGKVASFILDRTRLLERNPFIKIQLRETLYQTLRDNQWSFIKIEE